MLLVWRVGEWWLPDGMHWHVLSDYTECPAAAASAAALVLPAVWFDNSNWLLCLLSYPVSRSCRVCTYMRCHSTGGPAAAAAADVLCLVRPACGSVHDRQPVPQHLSSVRPKGSSQAVGAHRALGHVQLHCAGFWDLHLQVWCSILCKYDWVGVSFMTGW